MASQSRELVRDAFATLLTTALVPTNKAQAVYNYQVGDFAQQFPIVTVTSGGSQRDKDTLGWGSTCWHLTCYINVHVFVLYGDGGTWGEDDAEDALDAIDATIADVIADNESYAGVWNQISYDARSLADGVEIGGIEYRREIISLRFEVQT